MTQYLQGHFTPKNTHKYVGNKLPIARSSWELHFMRICDTNEAILHWASEPLRIPYLNPVTGKLAAYVPDFLIEYVDSKNTRHVELLEIKPHSQTLLEAAKTKRDKLAAVVNSAKWEAAMDFARKNQMFFRVITEKDLYHNYKRGK